jgi:hypothetical protein
MVGFVITIMFALDAVHTTAAPRTGVRPAV